MRTLALLSLTLIALALAACDSAPPTVGVVETGARPTPTLVATPTATPDVEATVSAAVAATATAGASAQATISAGVAATITAQPPTPTAVLSLPTTSVPTPTPMPTATPVQVAAPTPQPTFEPVPDFDAEAYFRGQTINLMVGFNPGGGTDAHARYMSRAWPRFIPGSPRVVVRNLTPVIVERNFVWNSEPDGLTLAVEATPGVFDQFTPQAQFDMRKVTVIGVTSGKEEAWIIRGTLPYGCIDSAFNATGPDLTVGWSALTPAELSVNVSHAWLADRFNLPLEVANASGTSVSAQLQMLEIGDSNSLISSTIWNRLPTIQPGWASSDFIRPFADLSMPGYRLVHNAEADFRCPNVADAYLEDDDLDLWIAMQGPRIYAAKNLIGPPGMPNEVTVALRNALTDAMTDDEFRTGLEDFTGIKATFQNGYDGQEELISIVDTYIQNKGRIENITTAMFEKYIQPPVEPEPTPTAPLGCDTPAPRAGALQAGECYQFTGTVTTFRITGSERGREILIDSFTMTDYLGEVGAEIWLQHDACQVPSWQDSSLDDMFYGRVMDLSLPQTINFRQVLVPVVSCIRWIG